MKKYILFAIMFLFGLLLHYDNLISYPYVRYTDATNLYKEKKNVIERGDTNAYKSILENYQSYYQHDPSKIFYYSFIMATKYHYVPANYDTYKSLISNYGTLDSLDKDTKHLALFFLRRGINRGDILCKIEYHRLQIKR